MFLLGITGIQAQNTDLLKPPYVDQRVELLSIVFYLEPDTEYQLLLSGWYFKSKENYSIKDYDINFKTKK